MKKRIWLTCLLLLLSAMDVIGTDELRLQIRNSPGSDKPMGSGGLHENLVKNDGIPPERIASDIQEDLRFFPIPQSLRHSAYRSSYEDSWMTPRTFGGERGHEGTDIMLTPDERGIFPVLSMTDGIIEKKGWLPKGGYRIGIRSKNGIYYYYAHLSDYASDIEAGDAVVAGQLLGFAGDSGYSNIEGTVGNFPVHLHVGIYYNDESGNEKALNPYPFLVELPAITIDF